MISCVNKTDSSSLPLYFRGTKEKTNKLHLQYMEYHEDSDDKSHYNYFEVNFSNNDLLEADSGDSDQ